MTVTVTIMWLKLQPYEFNHIVYELHFLRDLTEDNKGENWDWPSVLPSDSNSIFTPNLK